MKRILSNLLVAALVILMMAGSLGTASAEQPAAVSIMTASVATSRLLRILFIILLLF